MARVTAAVALAEARRDIHELLYSLPAWDADKVRDKLALLEQAVREKVADDIEKLLLPETNDAAKLRNGGLHHAARIARGEN